MIILSVVVFFYLNGAFADLAYPFQSCDKIEFSRVQDMDGYKFTSNVLREISAVQNRAACFSDCLWDNKCNLVLYKPSPNVCRLYLDVLNVQTGGSSENGWQFYAVSCSAYRLSAESLANVSPTCAAHQQKSCSCAGDVACWDGDKLKCVAFECINYFSTPRVGLTATQSYTETLKFDLSAGMKIVADVSGVQHPYNEINIYNSPNYVFHCSIRWNYNRIVFNHLYTWWGTEVSSSLNPTSVSSRYRIDIDVMDNTFEIYMDGQHRLSAPIRLPLKTYRTLGLSGITAIHSFEVHTNGACS